MSIARRESLSIRRPFGRVILSTTAFAPSRPISWFLWWFEEGFASLAGRLAGWLPVYIALAVYARCDPHETKYFLLFAYVTARRTTAIHKITFIIYVFLSSLLSEGINGGCKTTRRTSIDFVAINCITNRKLKSTEVRLSIYRYRGIPRGFTSPIMNIRRDVYQREKSRVSAGGCKL